MGREAPIRIGYVPYSSDLNKPGDRRRFIHYAKTRSIDFELADPSREYDLVVLSECADVSVWSNYRSGKIVYDLIDSYLAIPSSDIKGLLRGLAKYISRQNRFLRINHWRAIEAMCKRADAVVCSTLEQKADILPFCGNVHIALDIHTSVTHTIKLDYGCNQRAFRLVWEGLPQNIASLTQLAPVLNNLGERYQIELHVVTDPIYYRYLGRYGRSDTLAEVRQIFPKVVMHEWRDSDLSDVVCSCDAAVIPLDLSNPFSSGKPENKLLLFWRMGMPVVVSSSPAYRRAMQEVGLDLSCKNSEEWIDALERLMCSQTLRQEAGEKGRAYAEDSFSEEKLIAAWDKVFESIGFNFKK